MDTGMTLDAVAVKSLYYNGQDVMVKLADGSWAVCEDPDLAFVSTFYAPPGVEVRIGELAYRMTEVGNYGVLQPQLLQSEAKTSKGDEPGNVDLMAAMKGLAEAFGGGRKRRRSRSGSDSDDDTESGVLPAELQDVALPLRVTRKLISKRFKEVELEQLLDDRDLSTKDRRQEKGAITTSDRVVKAVTVLARYRSAYFPKETPHLLKFLYNVQELTGAYEFAVVSQVVRKHLRAVAAGMSWNADMALGRVDQRDQLPLCKFCKVYHLTGACGATGATPTLASGTSGGTAWATHRKPLSDMACFKCGVRGHFARACTQKPREESQNRFKAPPRFSRPPKFGVQQPEDN